MFHIYFRLIYMTDDFQNVVIVNICLTIYSIQIVTRGYVTVNCVFTAVKTLQNNLFFGL
jgi:hypothetical protein